MRLCLYNPQAVQSVLGQMLISKIFRSDKEQVRANSKLGYFLDLLNNREIETAIVVDGTTTSLISSTRQSFLLKNKILIKAVSFVEIYLWCYFNEINPFKQKIIFDLAKINPKKDILLGFVAQTSVFFDRNDLEKSFFKKYKGRKIAHLSHYFLNTAKLASYLNEIKPDLYISEADLSKNQYFKKYFKYKKKVYVLPYVLRSRYVSVKDFSKRKNKCLALGTLFMIDKSEVFKDVYSFFKQDTLQPMRKEIYFNRTKIKKYIDSYIYRSKSTLKISFWRKFFNLLSGKYSKYKYFDFNIVEKYNDYKMFVSPEENTGPPSINFVEGMACGCAYVGVRSYIYDDLGLIDGENFIAYDGTLDDLKKKIAYYQKHNKKLEKIAQKGRVFVRNNFVKEKVLPKFLADMEKMFF